MNSDSQPVAQGSITKGVLLNVGLNLFICLIWLPLCGLGGGYNSTGIATNLGVLFFFGAVFIGLTQLLHVIPMAIYLHRQDQRSTLTGMLRAAAVTLGLWLLGALIVSMS